MALSLPTGYASHASVVWFYTSYFVFRCFLSSSDFTLDIGPKCNSWKNLFDPLVLLMDRQGIAHQIITASDLVLAKSQFLYSILHRNAYANSALVSL